MSRYARHAAMVALAFVLSLTLAGRVAATPKSDQASLPPPQGGVDNETCLACHATPGMTTELPSGELLFLTVDPETFNASVHGALGYACVQCHENISGFPHEPITAQTRREFTLDLYTSCAKCHPDKFEAQLDSVHAQALAAGNENAAVCTDCHGAHDVMPPDQPRSRTPKTCQKCHSQIYDLYKASVHGAALIGEGNPDVPSCIDCHGVHSVQGPSSGPFHLFSPTICAQCHADQELMAKYGISTQVFDTYISDFHGTTVLLFEKVAPDQESNKPVCVDCHGVHDILPAEDPRSSVMKANLAKTCQKCHPQANIEFPDAWLSHYQPSPQKAPLVYYVNLFYKILIPTTVGGMLVFVLTDAARRISRRGKEARHG